MSKQQRRKLVDVVGLTIDQDELMELLSNANSLHSHASKELEFRSAERNLIRKRLKQVRDNSTEVRATDHAIVRYLERVVGMDIEALKKEMVSKLPDDFEWSEDKELVELLNIEGMQYVVRDRLIISVCPVENKT